jgi:multidrug resistance efflux pump
MKGVRRVPRYFWLAGLLIVTAALTGWGCLDTNFAESTTPANGRADAGTHGLICLGHVDVEQGVTRLGSAQSGRIMDILVEEGQRVSAGAALLRLESDRQQALLRQAESALRGARLKQAQAGLVVQVRQLEQKLQQLAAQAAANRLETARDRLAARREQLPAGRREELEDAVRDLDVARRAEEKKLGQVQLQIEIAQREAAQAAEAVQAAEEQLKLAQEAVDETVLAAPFNGQVLRLRARPGELVGPTFPEPLIEFTPDQPYVIRAEVPQEFASQVRLGAACRVVDDANPAAGTWRGTVGRISDWYTQRRSVPAEPFQLFDVRTLECIVRLEPPQTGLRLGQRVQVTIDR